MWTQPVGQQALRGVRPHALAGAQVAWARSALGPGGRGGHSRPPGHAHHALDVLTDPAEPTDVAWKYVNFTHLPGSLG